MKHDGPTTPLDEVVTKDLFKCNVLRWAERIGVEVKEIHIRTMTGKWASASTSGRLTFDYELLRRPAKEQTEAVIHELLHLKVGNHGPLFRRLLRAHLAEWEAARRREGKVEIFTVPPP